MAELTGKKVLITGGSGGIGNAAIRLFAERGARVACTYHRRQPEVPASVSLHQCDVQDREAVFRVFDEAASTLGGIDVLVHAAGMHGSCPADKITAETWDAMFDANVKAAVWTNQAAFQHMRKGGGSIINMGSSEGVRGFAGNATYAASRGAVMAWTRSVAQEWGRLNVRVNCVAPVVATEIFARQKQALDAASLAALDQKLAQVIPLGGQLGDPLADLAPVLAFLANDDSHFITGQTIAVDGGFMMLGS